MTMGFMTTPNPITFTRYLEKMLKKSDLPTATLISERKNDECFGDAEVIFLLDDIWLKFLKDRQVKSLEVGVSEDGDVASVIWWSFETVAVSLEDITLEKLSTHYKLNVKISEQKYDECAPPGPYYQLDDAISLVTQHWKSVTDGLHPDCDLRLKADKVAGKLQKQWEEQLGVSDTANQA